MASSGKQRMGDRNEGRLLRTLPGFNTLMPYIMPTRVDSTVYYEESFNVGAVEKWVKGLRDNGYKGIGMLHFIIAAYVRCVSVLPGINRFVIGRRIFARNSIEVVLTIKKKLALSAPETTVKIKFEPTDTIYDVYRKINEKINEVKMDDGNNDTEDVADTLVKMPRFLLKFVMMILRVMDYYGWLPEKLTDVSPFHASLFITDLGSLRIGPVFHHIYNFGTIPLFFAFGSKYHKLELDKEGDVHDNKYIDIKVSADERICDGYYFSQFLLAMRSLFEHPEILETPPGKGKVVEDVF